MIGHYRVSSDLDREDARQQTQPILDPLLAVLIASTRQKRPSYILVIGGSDASNW
jgi:hypothetical protein